MFRVPPSPFHLGKSSFQPVVANPIKLPSRRLSNTSNEPTKPLSKGQPPRQDEVISESEPESKSNSYHSKDRPSHVVVKSTVNGTVKDVRQPKGGKQAENAYENSIIKNSFQETDEESVIKDSFYEMQDTDTSLNPTRTIITPPPITQKRKRHSLDESRKRKKRQNLDLPDRAKDSEMPTSPKKVSKDTLPQSQEIPVDKDIAAEPSTTLSKRERKEERRRRKQEKQEKQERKEERRRRREKRATIDSTIADADELESQIPNSAQQELEPGREPEFQCHHEDDVSLLESQAERTRREGERDIIDPILSDAEEPEFQIPNSAQQERETVQESDVESQNEDDFSLPEAQEPETDKAVVVRQGKPSRKRNQGHKMEIPATQELQDQGDELDILAIKNSPITIPENSIPRTSDSNIQKLHETPGKFQKIQKRNAKPVVSSPKQARRQPRSPRAPNKRRTELSKARIVDSSAEDDNPDTQEDDESQQITPTSKRRKVRDLEKLRTFIRKSPSVDVDDSDEKETTKSGQHKIFSTKEDERLHRIVTQYKEVTQLKTKLIVRERVFLTTSF